MVSWLPTKGSARWLQNLQKVKLRLKSQPVANVSATDKQVKLKAAALVYAPVRQKVTAIVLDLQVR